MINKIRNFINELRFEWDEFIWKNSPERKELARLRLIAHRKAMKEGLPSPYTDPEKYNMDWELIR